jgi:hypothetical protein
MVKKLQKNLGSMSILFGNGIARSNYALSNWAEEGDIVSGVLI